MHHLQNLCDFNGILMFEDIFLGWYELPIYFDHFIALEKASKTPF